MAVTFEPGKQGYIDLSNDAIVKLSDADFPSFTHWRTISEGAGPFNSDGLCDIEQLKTMLGDANASSTSLDESLDELAAKNKRVSAYLNDPDRRHVREQLRGFVCEAPTEWDTSNVEARYRKLLEPGEHFEGKKPAYDKFIDFAKRFCIWGKTGLPDGKLRFFHPLQFIRHFRRCGWLSANEFDQLLPTEVLRENDGKLLYEPVIATDTVRKISQKHRPHLNIALRKHCITTPVRMAAFFGNSLQETTWLSTLHENNPNAWYWPWDGRGFLQLTHPGNYISYWDYRARNSQIPQKVRDSLSNAHGKVNKQRSEAKKYLNDVANGVTPEMLLWRDQLADKTVPPTPEDPISPADSAGFYWSKMQMGRYADQAKPLERRVVHAIRPPDKKNPNLPNPPRSKIYYHSMSFRDASAAVNLPAAVGNPERYFNGYIARCVAHAQVLAVVGEPFFPDAAGAHTLHFPEGRTLRREKPKKAKS
ncbi:hypothetical protein PTE30175_00773 [Pandoraea terrae]|uniref:Uncharacterized protein n=1 Tax=Pandoraea terrae TaxID=1537710 RepID=A0A5E4SI99_9BURK|nr:hypothetical protein PTE30175_00773 [Pandoraea terrae]